MSSRCPLTVEFYLDWGGTISQTPVERCEQGRGGARGGFFFLDRDNSSPPVDEMCKVSWGGVIGDIE